jgi:hypothetical protein
VVIGLLSKPRAEACTSVFLPAREAASLEWLDPVVCTARPQYDHDGQPKRHRGKHRAKLGRVRVRWTDAEAVPGT